MNAKLTARLELFDKNNRTLIRKYWLKHLGLQILSSFIYTCSDREADLERMDECRRILKDHFGVFSSARDMLELPLMASMAVSGNPDGYAARLAATYQAVRKGTVLPGDFEMLASITLMDTPEYRLEETAEKMKRIYRKMRKNHPLLTSSSDKTSAAMFTLSDRDEDLLLEEMEACFAILRKKLRGRGEAVQTMSAFLAIQEGSAEEKCARTLELCDGLKAAKLNLKMSSMLPVVAGLSVLELPVDSIVEGVREAADALKGRKGFGAFGLGREGRTVYAIVNYLAASGGMGDAASAMLKTEVLNLVIQEIITLMLIMTSAQIAANSSSSSN